MHGPCQASRPTPETAPDGPRLWAMMGSHRRCGSLLAASHVAWQDHSLSAVAIRYGEERMARLADHLLPTTVVGAHGRPSWLHTAKAAIAAGGYGPTDIRETLDDAVAIAILDQTRAGIDVITDGEMRREGFTGSFARRIANLELVG